MKYPDISPNFTLEDIHKIREFHAERRRLVGEDAFWGEIAAAALQARGRIKAKGGRASGRLPQPQPPRFPAT